MEEPANWDTMGGRREGKRVATGGLESRLVGEEAGRVMGRDERWKAAGQKVRG